MTKSQFRWNQGLWGFPVKKKMYLICITYQFFGIFSVEFSAWFSEGGGVYILTSLQLSCHPKFSLEVRTWHHTAQHQQQQVVWSRFVRDLFFLTPLAQHRSHCQMSGVLKAVCKSVRQGVQEMSLTAVDNFFWKSGIFMPLSADALIFCWIYVFFFAVFPRLFCSAIFHLAIWLFALGI